MYSLLFINNNEYIISNRSELEVITRRTAAVSHNGLKTIASIVNSGSKTKMLNLMKELTKASKKEPKSLKNPNKNSSGRNFIPCGVKKKMQSHVSIPKIRPSTEKKYDDDTLKEEWPVEKKDNIERKVQKSSIQLDSAVNNHSSEMNAKCGMSSNSVDSESSTKSAGVSDFDNSDGKLIRHTDNDDAASTLEVSHSQSAKKSESARNDDLIEDTVHEEHSNEDSQSPSAPVIEYQETTVMLTPSKTDPNTYHSESSGSNIIIPIPSVPCVPDSRQHDPQTDDSEHKKQEDENGIQKVCVVSQEELNADPQSDSATFIESDETVVILTPSNTDPTIHDGGSSGFTIPRLILSVPYVPGSEAREHQDNGTQDAHIASQEELNADGQNHSPSVIQCQETPITLIPPPTDSNNHGDETGRSNIITLTKFACDRSSSDQNAHDAEIKECRPGRLMTLENIVCPDGDPDDEDAEVSMPNISAEGGNSQGICSTSTSFDENGKRRSLQEIIRDEFQDLTEEDFTQNVFKPAETTYEILNQLDDPELNEFMGLDAWGGNDFTDRDMFINPNDIFNEPSVSTPSETVNEKMKDKNENQEIIENGDSSNENEQDHGNDEEDRYNNSHDSLDNDPTWNETSRDKESTAAADTTAGDTENADTAGETSLNSSIEPQISCKTGAMDKRSMKVYPKIKKCKENFCYYCHTRHTAISRHLEARHKSRSPVKKFHNLPKGNLERRKIIETLRLKGNALFNTDAKLNPTGEMFVARRPKEERSGIMYDECHNCGLYASVNTIRRHRQSCIGPAQKGKRGNKILSRFVEGRIHKDASERLAAIFSVLRENDVVALIRYDELLIRFGNGMAETYVKIQQEEMIRNRLRTLGRLLKIMKELDPNITDFKSIYHPKRYKVMVEAVKKMAGFNAAEGECDTPSTVTTVGTYIKAVGDILKLYWIENVDEEQEKLVEKYLFLHKMQYSQAVNRVALEDQNKKHRQNVKPLPTTADIQKLSEYVNAKRTEAMEKLKERYTYDAWLDLGKYLLISVQIFNRKRAGEIERTLISDLKSTEKITEKDHPDVYHELSEEQKILAGQYSRFIITGKRSSNVAVLLDAEMERCFGVLLSHRKSAKVPAKNPYVFGIPGYSDGRFKYLRACKLMNQFSNECGAKHPERLRGTFLRKQLATSCAANNMDENQVVDIASFMGHHEKIHRSHYRQSVVTRDVVNVSQVLRKAMGDKSAHQNPDPPGRSQSSSVENNSATRLETDRTIGEASRDDVGKPAIPSHSPTCNQTRTVKRKRQRVLSTSSSSDESDSEQKTPPRKRQKTNKKRRNDREENSDSSEADVDSPPREQKKRNPKAQSSRRSESHDAERKRKRRWTDEEKELAFRRFGDVIRDNKSLSTKEIRKFLKDHPAMERTVEQIRTWASNEKKKWNLGL